MKKKLFSLTSLALFAGALNLNAAVIVNVDATNLGVGDGTPVTNLSNPGTAGNFASMGLAGDPVTASHNANNAAVPIQGVAFSGQKMKSLNTMVTSGIGVVPDQPFTVKAWVWNPAIGAEEAMISWGHRGGPDGSNMGFHQGTDGTFGAVGHWGAPDVGWGGGGANINGTIGRWAQLAYVYDGASGQRVFIDGVLDNTDVSPAVINPHQTFGDPGNPPTHIYLGSESDAGNENSTPIAFSGTIARWYVEDRALSDAEIAAMFALEAPLFFDGIPEPSAAVLALLGAALMVGRRRRR